MKIEMSISNKIEILNSVLLIFLLLFFIYVLKMDILKLDDPYYRARKVISMKANLSSDNQCANTALLKLEPKTNIDTKSLSNLFQQLPQTRAKPKPQKVVELKPAPKEHKKKSPNYQKLLNQLSVNGVMKGPNPKAVIYNKRSGQTTFITVGDNLLNTFTVVSIENDKIVLEADGRNFAIKF